MEKAKPEDFGFTKAWLKKHPQVQAVVNRAIRASNQGGGWSQQRLQTELKNTAWYRKLSRAQREWDLMSLEPGERRQRLNDSRRLLEQTASMMGIRLSKKERQRLALAGARNQWDDDDYRLAVVNEMKKVGKGGIKQVQSGAGLSQRAWDQIAALEQAYLVRMDGKTKHKMVTQILSGNKTIEDYESQFKDKAASMYGGAADEIRAGATTMDALQPYLVDAAEELGVTPATLNEMNSKWTAALTGGKDGKALTREEWQTLIRTDKRYGWDTTIKAQNEAAELGSQMLQLFGMR